jgi:putative nucleotidyltransferase with HDIG domain
VVPYRSLAGAAQRYILLVVLVGIAIVPAAWLLRPIPFTALPELLYLAIAIQLATLMPIEWKDGRIGVVDPFFIAAGLLAPGAGVGLVAWSALNEPSKFRRGVPHWPTLFNRANVAIAHAIPSLAVSYLIPADQFWTVPVRTILYVAAFILINYPVAARVFGYINGTGLMQTLLDNITFSTLRSVTALGFGGAIVYQLLQVPVGYLIVPGFFAFLVAVRGNLADVQRQALAREQTLTLAAQALDARDPYTESHSARVGQLAMALARQLQLSSRECDELRTAGTLHDIGKIGIRDHILNKATGLTPEEWEIMKQHASIGADMVSRHSALAPIAPMVRHHHERWDGSGYPAGLLGSSIPLGARILAVADSYDTITTPRLYRPTTMTALEAIDHLTVAAGRWYDFRIVNALRALHGLDHVINDDRVTAPVAVSPLRLLVSNPRLGRLVASVAVSSLGDPLTIVASLVTVYAVSRDARFVAAVYGVQAVATVVMTSILGGLADRFPRRYLVVGGDIARALILLSTPFLLARSYLCLYPILLVLAALNAVVQPARQASVPDIVNPADVGRANALVTAATMAGGVAGFPLAGLLLWFGRGTTPLFLVDSATFVGSVLLVLAVGSLGGGQLSVRITSGFREALRIRGVGPRLITVAAAAVLLSMSFPALIALAYEQSRDGAQAFTILEATLAVGVVAGSLIVARVKAIGTIRLAVLGLAMTGVFSIGVAVSHNLILTGLALLVASVGNAIYIIAITTNLLEMGKQGNRGSIMAARFGAAQGALVGGTAIGGILVTVLGPHVTYAVLAVGLLALAVTANRFTRDSGQMSSGPMLEARPPIPSPNAVTN